MEENIIQSQPLVETPPNPTKSWLKIALFAGLGLVLVSGLIFAGIQIGRRQSQPVTQPTPTPLVVILPTLTPTPPRSLPQRPLPTRLPIGKHIQA